MHSTQTLVPLNHKLSVPTLFLRFSRPLQRLVAENLQQQHLIEQLVLRVDHVEELMQAWQEDQRRREQRTAWGGFFAPRGLQGG